MGSPTGSPLLVSYIPNTPLEGVPPLDNVNLTLEIV
jgi:hypothetical protein